jgi:hypothetical protein
MYIYKRYICPSIQYGTGLLFIVPADSTPYAKNSRHFLIGMSLLGTPSRV